MKIQIRPWQPEDVDMLMAWIEKDHSIMESLRVPEGTDLLAVRARIVLGAQDPTQMRFVAFRENEPVAAIAIYDAKTNGSAMGAIIANPFNSTGFSTVRAAQQALAAMFNGIGLTDLTFAISENNEPALKLARMIGAKDLNVRVLNITKKDYEEDHGPGDGTRNR